MCQRERERERERVSPVTELRPPTNAALECFPSLECVLSLFSHSQETYGMLNKLRARKARSTHVSSSSYDMHVSSSCDMHVSSSSYDMHVSSSSYDMHVSSGTQHRGEGFRCGTGVGRLARKLSGAIFGEMCLLQEDPRRSYVCPGGW